MTGSWPATSAQIGTPGRQATGGDTAERWYLTLTESVGRSNEELQNVRLHSTAVRRGKQFPGPQSVSAEWGVAYILQNPRRLCLRGLSCLDPSIARTLASLTAGSVVLGNLDGRSVKIWKAAQAQKEV